MIDTRTTPLPVETVTPIRPSEAIRLGCLIAPKQAFGTFDHENGSACAAAAMALARGWSGDGPRYPYTPEGEFARVGAPCGCLPSMGFIGSEAVWHMNDAHRWSRERIADWLESIGL